MKVSREHGPLGEARKCARSIVPGSLVGAGSLVVDHMKKLKGFHIEHLIAPAAIQ